MIGCATTDGLDIDLGDICVIVDNNIESILVLDALLLDMAQLFLAFFRYLHTHGHNTFRFHY